MKAQPISAPRRVWKRWWFHLGALTALIPLIFLKSYIDSQALFLHAQEDDLRSVDVAVGPWALKLQEAASEEPYNDPGEGLKKEFRVVPCPACVGQIRAIFVNLKRPGSTEYGAEAEGNPYRAFAQMSLGRAPSPDDMVWITAEGWDGSFHQAKVPLAEASPIAVDWLKARDAETPTE